MTSTDWKNSMGAPLLPKVSPYCIPTKMMELKRRPTLYDIRGSGWQLRHKRAKPGEEVPWERVFYWPPKQIHVITNQELFKPRKQKKKRVVKKGAKVVKAPPTPVREKKFVAKFIVRYDFQRVLNYLDKRVVGAQAAKRAPEAAPAGAATASTTAPTARTIFSRPFVPGAFPGDDDAAAADVDAQTQSAADDQAQPSLLAAIFSFAFGLFFGRGASKRAHEDDTDNETGDAKRRRVGLDAQAPAPAEARPAAGNAARSKTTGATAPKHLNLTTNAAQRRARINAPKASLIVCPPPTRKAPVAGNAKVVEALSMLPPLAPVARPIAGRPTRKRADTPDPRAGTPSPSEPEASSAVSTPTSSPSSSRSSSPASSRSPSPSPAPESKSSKSKSSSSKSKSSSKAKSSSSKSKSSSKSSSSKSKSTSSKSTPSSSESSSSKARSSSSESKTSSKSKASSSETNSSSSETKSSSSKSNPSSQSKSSWSEANSPSSKYTSSIRPWHTRKPMAERSSLELAMDPSTVSGSMAITLLPPNIRWSRDGELVNPWDPRCPAAPDPVFPWAPACDAWVNARAAPIAPLPEAPSAPSFVRPTRGHASAPAALTSAPHRAGSPVPGDFSSGEETEVESGGEETDDEE